MPNQLQPESRQIGTTTIHVYDDEFFNGFQAGTLLYYLQAVPSGFTDAEIYAFICKHSQSAATTDRYRAGCVSGWFAALYGYRPQTNVMSASCVNPCTQERGVQA